MKKAISLVLAVIMMFAVITCVSVGAVETADGALVFGGATADNIFGDLIKWNGFFLNNVSGLLDAEGSVAVAGDFTSNTSFSCNLGEFGSPVANSSEITFLVGNNIKIEGYGSVKGTTAIGNPDGNTYHLTNITDNGSSFAQYEVVDCSQFFADATATALNANKALSALEKNAENTSAYGSYVFEGNPDVDTLVYELDDTMFNCFSWNFNLEDGQVAILNLTAEQAITMQYGCVSINGNRSTEYLRNNAGRIVVNVVNGADINFIGTELYGIILAPESDLTAENGNICRTTIVNNLIVKYGFELHLDDRKNPLPSISVPTTSEPATEAPVETTAVVTEAPTEAPIVTEPATEADPTEAPVVTEPATEAPTEAPVVTEPATEADPTEAPVVTEPATEADPTEAPVVTEPATEADPTEAPVVTEPATEAPTEAPVVTEPAEAEKVELRIETPGKMAVVFEDGEVFYNKEIKEIEVGKEYHFQMGTVNWENGILDGEENGIIGEVVYTLKVVHQDEFNELKRKAIADPDRYTIKGMDIIDNETKTIVINCDAENFHLETDVNNFFMAYRFHFTKGDYNKQTGIKNVVNTPLESLSINLPLGATVKCDAYKNYSLIDSADVLITNNSGEGIYRSIYLTCVNDYYWNY